MQKRILPTEAFAYVAVGMIAILAFLTAVALSALMLLIIISTFKQIGKELSLCAASSPRIHQLQHKEPATCVS